MKYVLKLLSNCNSGEFDINRASEKYFPKSLSD